VRIGLDARYVFRAERRGPGQYVAALLEHLPDVAHERDEFFLYGERGVDVAALQRGDTRFRVRRLGAAAQLMWEEVALPLAARQDGLDLLHLAGTYGPTLAGCPTVHTIHDTIEYIRPTLIGREARTVRNHLGQYIRTRTLPRQAARARRVIAPTHAAKRDIRTILHVPDAHISVVPHGVGVECAPAPDPAVVRARLRTSGYRVPDRYALVIGSADPRKNGRLAMRAAARARIMVPDLQMIVVGPERPDRYPLPFAQPPAWLTVHGYVPRRDLVDLFQGSTLFLYPSLYEGFGLPVLEAMACGVPVIASDHAAIREVAGDACAFFDPRNEAALTAALVGLWRNGAERRWLREAGLRRVTAFSWTETVRATYAIYQRCAAVGERSEAAAMTGMVRQTQ
jgi:glycosyltransferase involved in cell wall biosynthesis